MINFPDAPTVGQNFFVGATAWMWDGVKWLVANSAPTGVSVNVVSPVSGTTVTLTDFRPVQVNNATTLAALMIKLPPSPSPTSYVQISFTSPVTALTIQNSTGTTVANAPTSAYGPGAAVEFRFNGSVWVYWK